MLELRRISLHVRRRSKPCVAVTLLAVCLLFWFTRPSLRVWDNGSHLQAPAAELAPSTHSNHAQQSVPSPNAVAPIPVIIFAFNRADNLRQTIKSVLSCASFSASLHPIFVSQDGSDAAVTDVIKSYGEQVQHLEYRWPGQTKPPDQPVQLWPYLKIAGHYQFALAEVMDRVDGHERWDRLIMLEDDMYVSPDFFSYFRRLSPLFDSDPSLYCVSAWNDQGQAPLVSDTRALYRTDCFPGLGWMWSREIWNELREWTPGWWDDWLRDPEQSKNRSCVYPEISRVYTFGRGGTSGEQYFDQWLRSMRLNDENVDWDAVEIENLHQEQYDGWIENEVRSATRVKNVEMAMENIDYELAARANAMSDVSDKLVEYDDGLELTVIMMTAGLVFEHKADIPRSSYRGILHFRYRGIRIWFAPRGFKSAVD